MIKHSCLYNDWIISGISIWMVEWKVEKWNCLCKFVLTTSFLFCIIFIILSTIFFFSINDPWTCACVCVSVVEGVRRCLSCCILWLRFQSSRRCLKNATCPLKAAEISSCDATRNSPTSITHSVIHSTPKQVYGQRSITEWMVRHSFIGIENMVKSACKCVSTWQWMTAVCCGQACIAGEREFSWVQFLSVQWL